MKTEIFSIANPELEIDINCDIALIEGASGQVRVEATGSENELKNLLISHIGSKVIIKLKNDSMSGVFVGGDFVTGNIHQVNVGGGNTVIQRNGATYINTSRGGAVYVNGKRVDIHKGNDVEPYEPIRIKVFLPGVNAHADISLSGSSSLAATASLGDVSLDCSGSSKFAITEYQDLDIDIAGSATGKVKQVTGDLTIDCSGSATLEVAGEFNVVRINGSGSARINTYGDCKGDYKVNGSGMLKLNHLGKVMGRVKRNLSGMCSVNI